MTQDAIILGPIANTLLPQFIKFYDVCVPAGFPSPALDSREEQIDLNKEFVRDPDATYVVKVKGDSMKSACIPDKCLVLVDKSVKVESGMVVVACIDDKVTCKFYIKKGEQVFLVPANKGYPTIEINESHNFQVFGPVIRICSQPVSYNRFLCLD